MSNNEKYGNVVAGVKVPYVSDKDIALKRQKVLENKLERIKEACSRLKNSPISKTDALKEIKNICLDKEDEKNMWTDLLGNVSSK